MCPPRARPSGREAGRRWRVAGSPRGGRRGAGSPLRSRGERARAGALGDERNAAALLVAKDEERGSGTFAEGGLSVCQVAALHALAAMAVLSGQPDARPPCRLQVADIVDTMCPLRP